MGSGHVQPYLAFSLNFYNWPFVYLLNLPFSLFCKTSSPSCSDSTLLQVMHRIFTTLNLEDTNDSSNARVWFMLYHIME